MKSPLATKEILTNNYNARKKPIIKFTPHHTAVVGAMAETIANNFNKNGNSANYVIGNDGTIISCVPEEYRAWTSSSEDNDTQAITVEVCNSTGEPEWKVSDAALEALINLGVDICRRYNLPGFTWTGNKNGTLTIHKMFWATACPGPYLESKMPYIAEQISKRLNVQKEVDDMLYKVQVGAFSIKANAENLLAELKAKGYNGFIVTVDDGNDAPTPAPTPTLGVGSKVKIKPGAKSYTGVSMASFVYNNVYTVDELKGDRAVLDKNGLRTAFHINNLILV
jgi:hypothetical protein